MSADYSADDVTQTERETTRRMVGHLLSMLADEPPQDAGNHPSLPLHEQVGAAWADWDRQRRAWQTLLAPRLLREAMDDVRGGPNARANTGGAS
jgi:hypothetical protein